MNYTHTTASKESLISALYAFTAQRSGINFRDYQSGNWSESRAAFIGDYRPILKHGRHARALIRAIELRPSITAEDLLEASDHAFSGRLQFRTREDGACAVDYTTGQYFPTEYRNAVCSVCASALWNYWRANMPKGKLVHNSETGETFERYDGLRAGDWIRRQARREFGRGIASIWFT